MTAVDLKEFLEYPALIGDACAAVVLWFVYAEWKKSKKEGAERDFRELLRGRRDWVSDYQSGDNVGRLAFMRRLQRLSSGLGDCSTQEEQEEWVSKASRDLQLRQYCFLMSDIKSSLDNLSLAERASAERKLKGTLYVEDELEICGRIESHLGKVGVR